MAERLGAPDNGSEAAQPGEPADEWEKVKADCFENGLFQGNGTLKDEVRDGIIRQIVNGIDAGDYQIDSDGRPKMTLQEFKRLLLELGLEPGLADKQVIRLLGAVDTEEGSVDLGEVNELLGEAATV